MQWHIIFPSRISAGRVTQLQGTVFFMFPRALQWDVSDYPRTFQWPHFTYEEPHIQKGWVIFSYLLSEQITEPVLISDFQTPASTLCPLSHTTAFHNDQLLAGSGSDGSESTVDFVLFLFYPGLLLFSRCSVPVYLFEDRFYIPFLNILAENLFGGYAFLWAPTVLLHFSIQKIYSDPDFFFCLLTLSWVLKLHVELCASPENDPCVGYVTVTCICTYVWNWDVAIYSFCLFAYLH